MTVQDILSICGISLPNTLPIQFSLKRSISSQGTKKLSAALSPVQLQQLSESMQAAMEFRKYVVAGYNSCAITKQHYADLGARFQALDGLSRRIDAFGSKSTLTQGQSEELRKLVKQYIQLSAQLGVSREKDHLS